MTNVETPEGKRRAIVPIDLLQAMVPWLHKDRTRAVGTLRVTPAALVATDGHRMVTVAPHAGEDRAHRWCGEAFSMPSTLLYDALALVAAPRDPLRSIDQILADEPAAPIKAKDGVVVLEQLGAVHAVEIELTNGHKVRVSTTDFVDEMYPGFDFVMKDFAKRPPGGDRGAAASKTISLNPAFLIACYHVAKVVAREPGVTLTGWSDDPRAPVFLQSIDNEHRARFALMPMNVEEP